MYTYYNMITMFQVIGFTIEKFYLHTKFLIHAWVLFPQELLLVGNIRWCAGTAVPAGIHCHCTPINAGTLHGVQPQVVQ